MLIIPGNSTWNLKITQSKRKIIFLISIFGFHVNFWGVEKIQRKKSTVGAC